MALEDVNFGEGETDGFITEIPSNVYNGVFSDIQTESGTEEGALVNELNRPNIVVDNRRRVR